MVFSEEKYMYNLVRKRKTRPEGDPDADIMVTTVIVWHEKNWLIM